MSELAAAWRTELPPSIQADVDEPAFDELSLARRLDWRFLLPDPQLKRVGCFGVTGRHAQALSHFCEAIDFDPPNTPSPKYDIVILRTSCLAKLGEAAIQVRHGGSLYAEFGPQADQRISWLQRASSAVLPRSGRLQLQAAGFDRVCCYWHWPNFENCTRILPVGAAGSLNLFLDQFDSRRLRSAAIRCAAAAGLLDLFFTSFSIVGVRST